MPERFTRTYEVIFKTSLPPSLNRIYRVYRGHLAKTREAKNFQALVAGEVGKLPYDLDSVRDVSLELHAVYPTKKRPDIDNILKVFLDALQGVLYKNDRNITSLFVDISKGNVPGIYAKAVITVEEG